MHIGILKKTDLAAWRQSHERYQRLFDDANDAIYTIDMDGRFTSVNRKALALTGYTQEEALTLNIVDVIAPEDLSRLRNIMARRAAGEEIPPYEIQIVTKNGGRIPVEISGSVIRQDGTPVGFQGIARDLTERRRVDENLRTRTTLMRRLLSIGESLAHPVTVPEAIPVIGEGALHLSGATRAAIILRQPDGSIACPWTRGLSEEYVAQLIAHQRELPAASMMAANVVDWLALPGARVVAGGHPYLYPDVELLPFESLVRRLAQFEGYQAVGAWPLVYEDRVTALISCYYETPHAWSAAEQDAFMAFCRQAALVLENARLYDAEVQSKLELILAHADSHSTRAQRARRPRRTLPGDLLGGLAALPEGAQHLVHMIDTGESTLDVDEHLAQVGQWSLQLATSVGLQPRQQHILAQAALVHDVGKLAVAPSLLRKPGVLSPEERALLVQHVTRGVALLQMLGVDERVITIVAAHHERWDGTGYPRGIAEEAIPLEARILVVADSYDAMIADRPYRAALTADDAVAELRRGAGHQFDPDLVDLFIRLLSTVH